MSSTSEYIRNFAISGDNDHLDQTKVKKCRDWELGHLKWFNSSKGFGFVTLSDGQDAFLHAAVLRATGFIRYVEGMPVEVRIYEERGRARVGAIREAP